jgi:hypothetical protein
MTATEFCLSAMGSGFFTLAFFEVLRGISHIPAVLVSAALHR